MTNLIEATKVNRRRDYIFPQECMRCGEKWDSSVEFPGKCTKCGCANFDMPEEKLVKRREYEDASNKPL